MTEAHKPFLPIMHFLDLDRGFDLIPPIIKLSHFEFSWLHFRGNINVPWFLYDNYYTAIQLVTHIVRASKVRNKL